MKGKEDDTKTRTVALDCWRKAFENTCTKGIRTENDNHINEFLEDVEIDIFIDGR